MLGAVVNPLTVLRCPVPEDDWRALGLTELRVGDVALEVGAPGWAFAESPASPPLGLETWVAPLPPGPPPTHPARIIGIDHVVLTVPDLDDAIEALVAYGLDLRRVGGPRAGVPMAFLRAGGTIVEVAQAGPDVTPRLSGVALRADEVVASPLLEEPHPALQGGTIAGAVQEWDGFRVAFYAKP